MKKSLSLLLALLLLCSLLTACQKDTAPAAAPETTTAEETPDVSYNPGEVEDTDPELSTETEEIDIEFDTPSFEYNPGKINVSTLAPITDFVFETPDFSYDVEPIEVNPVTPVEVDFDDEVNTISGLEIAGIEIAPFTFDVPDMTYEYDSSNFDVAAFKEASQDNFKEEDLAAFNALDDAAVIEIAEQKSSLLADLSGAFQSSGLNVTVDATSGEIMMDSAILFGVDEDAVSDLGKAMLRRFLAVYTSVVFSEKYDGFISQIVIEGHTDTAGDYDYNLDLSQRRADNVLAYCVSDENGLDPEGLTAVGYSYDKPILDDAGEVDMDASRRVSFRFLISLS